MTGLLEYLNARLCEIKKDIDELEDDLKGGPYQNYLEGYRDSCESMIKLAKAGCFYLDV